MNASTGLKLRRVPRLSAKSAIIFGGTGAIGSEIAAGLLEAGAIVYVVSRGLRSSAPLQAGRAASGRHLEFVQADALVETEVERAFKSVKDQSQNLEFVIYSVGRHPDVEIPLSLYPLSSWMTNIGIYVTGFLCCFQQALKWIGPGGHIVALSSAITRFTAESLPPFHAGHYAAAKASLNELCKWGRREAHEKGILLSRLAPAAVESEAQKFLPVAVKRPMLSTKDVANKVLTALQFGTEIDEELFANNDK
jgi:NAD(P)-dependent dehydrogenase (short-subunit alcohol dehydrogenase family)